ncbi:hypothetical protein A2773_05410 [Candidatus Gottesmanbacteria bacterium RIFCSPHIGHO2_01_FULL_39_10]|uniref:TrbL/VirB6 plasmid conjugal transfer protein n=1 Tax=Candidatus Gottesmanbacteria bacterium RIFCSPHIGHO2_01_FULL_39_10 TaxID=1798375 RepID=A0A1F5ZPW5_9BACT|nr:MAG: hypothetical protein A2773_05410 [Candidatus Gottesmanbacteria bacterium RIFCSPHIGHO2_01_FULL_39_10]
MQKLPQSVGRILLIPLFFSLFFFLSKSFVAADEGVDYTNDQLMINEMKKECDSTSIEGRCINDWQTKLTLLNITKSISCFKEVSPGSGNLTSCPSAMNYLAKGMSAMYGNPPASFGWYASDFLANAGLVKSAYAQGIGFVGLKPLLPLWTAMRNVSYTILVIVMVAIGFMIIFRMKLDPKTVISVQAALPKIILTLLLITFSYAIAGLLIDLMYVVMAVAISLLSQGVDKAYLANLLGANASFLTDTAQQQQEFMTGSAGKLFSSVFSLGMFPGFLINFFQGSFLNALLIQVVGGGLAATVALHVFAVPALAGAGIFLLAPVAIILFILFLGLLFTFIRLFLLLLNSYIQVIIAIILAPILLLPEAIPGKSAFGGWLMNIVANLSVFPSTVIIIYASWIVTSVAWRGALWTPPLLTGSDPLSQNGNPLAFIIGIGFMFLAPNLVVSIKKIFQPKPTVPISAGTMLSPLTGGISTSMGAMSQFYYMQQFLGTGAFAGLWKRIGLGGSKNQQGS